MRSILCHEYMFFFTDVIFPVEIQILNNVKIEEPDSAND